jgi:tetratricopeptide (TPR) repeat protein
MKLTFYPIQLILMSAFSIGCALAPQKNEIKLSDLTSEQREQLNREALSIASDRLEKMVVQAKSISKESVNYLATDLFLKANMSLMEGDYTTASVLFKHVVDLVPEDIFIQKKYAISLIRVGDLENAQAVLENIYSKTNDEKVGLILAGVFTGLDKEPEARKVYQAILKDNPKNEDACVFLGKSYAIGNDVNGALNLLKKCALRNPKSGMYYYYIGKVHIDQGKIEEALKAFKLAHKQQPDLSQAVNALGVIYEEREQHAEAIKVYANHLKNNPNDTTILNRMIHVLFLKEKYAEVIPYAEQLCDLEPDNINLKVKLGILYTDAQKYQKAISIFKDLLVVAPGSDKILYYLGAIYQEIKDYNESIEYFNQIPSSSGLYSDSSVQMANMLSTLAQEEFHKKESNEYQDRFLTFVNSKIEEIQNMKVEFSVIKAGFYENVSLHKKAMEALVQVKNEENFSTQHKYYLANLYEKEKRFEDSTSLIMSIIEKEPRNAHAWNFLGYSLLVRGEQLDKAYEYIQTALSINPNDGYIRDSLGWYYYKQGNIKKALSELELALKQVPDDVEILKHLGTIHQELKNYSKARVYFESALKNARLSSDRQEILSSIESMESKRIPASE